MVTPSAMTSDHDADELFMRAALDEGAQGLGLTSPNPPVGAVVLKDGELLGKGWHRRAGEAHAERHALAEARASHGDRALRGATIYVTLEPCSTHGRTPPCTEAILEAGIRRVVVGATDPNPAHAGAGLEILKKAGVEVVTGVLEPEARELIRFFAKHITTGLPWVIAKTACTLDGRTTLPEGMGPWISGEASREDVQRWRRQCDAILVGGETLRRDDPALTLRGPWAEGRAQPWRVILSQSGDLPPQSRVFHDAFANRTLVHRGLPIEESLRRLGREGVTSVMLESGGRLLGEALAAGAVDEVILYYAPLLGGGGARLLPAEGLLARLEAIETERFGDDLRIRGKVRHEH